MCAGLIQEWISHLNYPACKGGEVWQILSRYRIGYIGFNRYRIGNLWISPIPIYRYYRQALGSPIPITDMVKVADIGIGYSPMHPVSSSQLYVALNEHTKGTICTFHD